MIDSITLKNFQSHINTKLVFSKGINVIVGRSNSGKTACLRGINLVNSNRPLGTDFIHHGAKESEITIEKTQNGKQLSVTRIRGK